jgi:plastocyanin
VVLIIPLLWISIDASVLSAQGTGRQIAVDVWDNSDTPEVIRVKAGDLIVFADKGQQLHSLTLIGHEQLLDTAYLGFGQNFHLQHATQPAPSPHVLGCNTHMELQGRIIIAL